MSYQFQSNNATSLQIFIINISQSNLPHSMSLQVKPISANIKKDTDLITKMDPYVICIVGTQKKKTNKSSGTHPKWEETLTFNAGPEKLEIEVWDKDRFSSDDLVGKSVVTLTQIYNQQKNHQSTVEVDIELKGEVMGTLKLEIHFEKGNSPWNNQNPTSGWGHH